MDTLTDSQLLALLAMMVLLFALGVLEGFWLAYRRIERVAEEDARPRPHGVWRIVSRADVKGRD